MKTLQAFLTAVVTLVCMAGCGLFSLALVAGMNNSITVAATAATASGFMVIAIFVNLLHGLNRLKQQNEERLAEIREQTKYLRYLARMQRENERR